MTTGVVVVDGVVSGICIEVHISSIKPEWVFTDEPPKHRIVITRPVVHQARAVLFSAGVLQPIRAAPRAGLHRPERRVLHTLRGTPVVPGHRRGARHLVVVEQEGLELAVGVVHPGSNEFIHAGAPEVLRLKLRARVFGFEVLAFEEVIPAAQ